VRSLCFLVPGAALLATSAIAATDAHPTSLVGVYDGGQMEIAAGLELTGDGHFRYGLSYGALDEGAAGTWAAAGDAVTLTVEKYESSDPDTNGKFGPSILKVEDGVLTLPRYDRVLRFRKQGK
jgi:hypothetical protein